MGDGASTGRPRGRRQSLVGRASAADISIDARSHGVGADARRPHGRRNVAGWIDPARMLPVACVHVVFTLPGELKAVALRNRKPLFNILFAAAAQTLLELGRNPQRLGALRGITAVLHTWTRDLRFHPHLHCVVTAGGLTPDATRWVDSRRGFLFPVAVLSTLFRGKFLAALERLHRDDALDLRGTAAPARDFAQLRTTLFSKPWVVYAKRPFAGPDHVFAYLGRYTHRVAISNHRLLAVTDDAVTIATLGTILSISYGGAQANKRTKEEVSRALLKFMWVILPA